ncbi:hypothetical protein [Anaerobacillus arseniciselenatis]|nr:hypothetical protein [Anaerobacillus arseniciselenatis]
MAPEARQFSKFKNFTISYFLEKRKRLAWLWQVKMLKKYKLGVNIRGKKELGKPSPFFSN